MKKMFVDVDTLNAFFGGGTLEVLGADDIRDTLFNITKLAKDEKISLIKFNDCHDGSEPEMSCNGGPFPLHAMKDTEDAAGIRETASNSATIFTKQTYDMFDKKLGNPDSVEQFIKDNEITEAWVYGLVGNICVEAAVIGLLNLGLRVYVFENAVVWMDMDQGIFSKGLDNKAQSMKRMREAGAIFAKAGL